MKSEYFKTNKQKTKHHCPQFLSITSVNKCHYCQGKYLNLSDSWNKLNLQSCVLQKKVDGSFVNRLSLASVSVLCRQVVILNAD